MRVVVCGSRDYKDRDTLTAVLDGFFILHFEDEDELSDRCWKLYEGRSLTIIDGQCPHGGADQLAHEWALDHIEDGHVAGLTTERHPPLCFEAWAFKQRDRAMVDSGADMLIAFVNKPITESRGTWYTLNYAKEKGVRTVLVQT